MSLYLGTRKVEQMLIYCPETSDAPKEDSGKSEVSGINPKLIFLILK